MRSTVSVAKTVCESATLNIASPGQDIKEINITSTGSMNSIPVSVMYHIWCHSHSHHHFCIAKIGRTVLPAFLIPLVEMLYLVIRTTLQDRILIAQKLTELLILTHCQFGRGNLLLDMENIDSA